MIFGSIVGSASYLTTLAHPVMQYFSTSYEAGLLGRVKASFGLTTSILFLVSGRSVKGSKRGLLHVSQHILVIFIQMRRDRRIVGTSWWWRAWQPSPRSRFISLPSARS